MFKKISIFIAACALLSLLSSFHLIQPVQKQYLKTIIIDAGHGLPDPGAQGDYSNESDVSLAIALKLGSKLQELLPEVNIIYTRNDANLPNHLSNKDVANRWRAQFANDNRGDLFICIHCNDAPPVRHSEFTGYTYQTYKRHGKKYKKKIKKYRYWTTPSTVTGTETYVWAIGKNDSKKSFVGSSQQQDTAYGEKPDSSTLSYFDSPEAKILASIQTKKYFDRSITLANYVEEEFVKEGRFSRGVKQRDDEGIWVLQATAMPSILVETGFISNPDEENYLNSDKGQNEVSYAIARAILRYKTGIENGATLSVSNGTQ